MTVSPRLGEPAPDAPAHAGGGRRGQILAVAARLFARHGYHGVSIGDIGAAVGVSGPALYRHFPGKEALLAEMLTGISEHLLAGGRARAQAHDDPAVALADLVAFHADFALAEPELIVVQDRDLANLADEPRRRVRRLQRTYVEVWVMVLTRVHPGLPADVARTGAHAAFGLLNSTPHSAEPPSADPGGAEPGGAALLARMALAALHELGGPGAPR